MKSLRTKQIIDILERDGIVNTIALAEQFGCSIETIRRDFNQLENLGIIQKVYGGAELKTPASPSISSFMNRQSHMAATKSALGERASLYIPDNNVVFLDSGTTVFECTRWLSGKHGMNYICSDIHSSRELLSHGDSDIYILGGKLTTYGTSSGAFAKEFLASLAKIDILLISAEGADPDNGLSNDEINTNNLKQRCLKKAEKTILVLDHTKFSQRGFYKMCDFTDIDILITDSGTPQLTLQKIRNQGVTVDVVPCPSEELSVL